MELFALADKLGGNLELAIKRLAESKRNPQSRIMVYIANKPCTDVASHGGISVS